MTYGARVLGFLRRKRRVSVVRSRVDAGPVVVENGQSTAERMCFHGADATDHRSPPPWMDSEAQEYWKQARAYAVVMRPDAGDIRLCSHATAKVSYWENHQRYYPHLSGE